MKRRRKESVSKALHGQSNKKHKASSSGTKTETAMVSSSIPECGSDSAYDVFLNFRGPDSRDTVIDVLYHTLSDAGLRVFLDDEEIRKGEEIEGELLRAITNTRIYIPVFSKDYASSKWCLRELAKMIDCREMSRGNTKKVIFPIFFDVDVKDVKLKSPVYTLALDKHKKKLDEAMVKQWEDALKKVARIKGWKLKDHRIVNLADLIKDEICSKLNVSKPIPAVPDHIVGIDDRIEDLMKLLEPTDQEVRFIAIHGIGGIGKTTLANLVYEKISSCFQCSCILDVQRSTSDDDMVDLQKKLLQDTVKLKSVEFSRPRDGIKLISQKLRNRKVLIVLDDVDKKDHLSNLAAESQWFGCGSRVIITTENTDFLDSERHRPYKMEPLNEDDALLSFCQHAFKKPDPPDKFRDISTEIVKTTDGHPLAIRAIGSLLCNKVCYETWEYRLMKLKEAPHWDVQQKLLISYKALEKEQQEIFLDIACFFNNKKKDDPFYFWQACRLYPQAGVEILVCRCLIKVNHDGRLCMHRQLRDLGRAIAQGIIQTSESQIPMNPSRLWSTEVAMDAIERQVAESIVALKLGTLNDDTHLKPERFAKSNHLKYLTLRGGNFNGNFGDVLQMLTWLSWFKSPPSIGTDNLTLKRLTVLKLSGSHINEYWEGWGVLMGAEQLKVLHLRECKSLTKTPDFSAFMKLERLILKDCEALEEISSPITKLKHLQYLKVSNGSRKHKSASSLEERPQLLPNFGGDLQSLEVLKVSNVGLTKLHPSIGKLKKLKRLCLRCTLLKQLPKTIRNLTSLAELDIRDSPIESLPSSIRALEWLEIKRDPVT